ncbi:Hypothetical protein Tpal_2206 [Trichococcus palustris]|uniref:Uncharacterized protein n=1 Tax=Trichococcus palustris TaxID=140314 RepID=A0A143YVU1_9LACT|nr:hypothetical protein [Trichococcus palustris]CZQ97989.1 Hypothetical protein Tpal_2206 [Trichococcus palustris]SFL15256.1 hypothetical protein SAMN04488076_12517 [Trichococcus palustris]
MDKKELDLILKHFGPEKEFIGDGYFRIREKDSNRYEMAYLAPACCGTSTYHPQITIRVEDEKIIPEFLMDMEETPIKNISYSDETSEVLEQELDKLCSKFLAVKNLTV